MNKQQFGDFLAGNRRAAGLTQKELAQRLHVTDKAVSKWERALSYPDVTLLEPLAEALDMGVEELMACRRAEVKKEAEPVQNLLEISRESLRKERRKSIGRIAAALLAVIAAALAVVWYQSTYVSEQRKDVIILKEWIGDAGYLYVQEGTHLLRLECGKGVDFDNLLLTDECYLLDCRWNRRTYQGTVHSCKSSGLLSLGGPQSMIGASLLIDDPLFGYSDVWQEFTFAYQDWELREPVFTYTFWAEEKDGGRTNLLKVENCLTYNTRDWDGDGEMELLVRTRWPEKPYTVYDMEDGVIEEIWPDVLSPEFEEALLTDEERHQRLLEEHPELSNKKDITPAEGEPL